MNRSNCNKGFFHVRLLNTVLFGFFIGMLFSPTVLAEMEDNESTVDAAPLPEGMGFGPEAEMPFVLNQTILRTEWKSLDGSAVRVELSQEEWESLENSECESCNQQAYRVKIGTGKEVDLSFIAEQFRETKIPVEGLYTSDGYVFSSDDLQVVWLRKIEAPEAGGMRLHFSDFQLAKGAEVYWFSDAGEFFGPYTAEGPMQSGEFWSNTLSGESGYVLMAGAQADDAFFSSSFKIIEVAVLRKDLGLSPLTEGEYDPSKVLQPCLRDGSCYGTGDFANINVLRAAIAHMIYQVGSDTYICTGGLVNDKDNASWIPYFLTANHCLNTQASASSLECVWDFQTSSCNNGYTDWASIAGFPRTLGAQLLANSAANDFTFLRLTDALPGGRWFLGWTTTTPAENETLYRLAHPKGAQQTYSTHSYKSSPGGICDGFSTTNFMYTYRVIGSTDGGSSGSPLVNVNSQIVGQLYGWCAEDGCGLCSTGCYYANMDGRFSVTYPLIDDWIEDTSAPYPSNDLFSDAIAISGASGCVSGNNTDAYYETNEPNHAGRSPKRSVWWRWTAPAGGYATIDTCDSAFDTVLAVYTGSAVDGLTAIASNDDACGTNGTRSRVEFTAVSGTTYRIAVDSYSSTTTGNISLCWSMACGMPSSITVPLKSTSGSYTVSWSVSSTSGASYSLQEATDSGFTTELRTAYSGTGTSTSITGRSTGVTYYYRVKATRSGYEESVWRTGSNGCYIEVGTGMCTPLDVLSCNSVITDTTQGKPSNIDLYSCVSWDESGPEAVYSFEASHNGDLTVTLDDSVLTADLDLLILEGSCLSSNCIAFGDTSVTFPIESSHTYFVIVDGFMGFVSPYKFSISCAYEGLEADVAPRPDGDGALLANDWVQVGRFVAGMDTPAPGTEFQRADCAPLEPCGDGYLFVNDWVQVGRYVAGLDAPQLQTGPTEAGTPTKIQK